jgi:hypothetical protein
MAREKEQHDRSTGETNRSEYRDNEDERDPLAGAERSGIRPDSKSEARGDARENVGNTARGTAASPSGPTGNDRTRSRPRADPFDDDLERD